MRSAILVLAGLLPAVSAAAPSEEPVRAPFNAKPMPLVDPNGGDDKDCPPISRYHAMREEGRVMPRNLAELPPADHYKAVYRKIGNCEVPIVAGFNPDGAR